MSLEHFMGLAARGKHPGSSGGEKMCRRIAMALLAGVPSLDASAIDGILEFIVAVERLPMATRDRLGADDDAAPSSGTLSSLMHLDTILRNLIHEQKINDPYITQRLLQSAEEITKATGGAA